MKISLCFALQGPVNKFDSRNIFNKGLYGVRLFECLNYQKSSVFMNLQNYLLKCSKILKKYLKN